MDLPESTTDPFETPFEDTSSTEAAPVDEPTRTAAAAGGRRKASRSLVRRICTLTLSLHAASRRDREALASLLGCKTDVESLVVAAMECDRTAVSRPSHDVLSIADIRDPFDAMIAATALAENGPRFRAAWAALRRGVPEIPANPPTNSAKAGAAFARAALGMEPPARGALLGPLDLIG